MSIGWIMFWKAVVIAVWIALVERWATFRRRKRDEGLQLKLNERTGVYEVQDWTAKVERVARSMRDAGYALLLLWWTVLGGTYLYGGREALRDLIGWLFFA